MKKNKSEFGQLIKREAVRAVLERVQSYDLEMFTPPLMKQNNVDYDDVAEELNIPYINREGIPLAMDTFWLKGTEDTEVPVIVLIHGGGLVIGDRRISRPFGRWLAHKGYLVFSLEYRLAPNANVAQSLDDVCAGLDKIGEKLVNYNVDFSRMFLLAESAGAYLATYVTAMHGSEKLQKAIGYKPSRFVFKGLGLICGMFYSKFEGSSFSEQLYGEKMLDDSFLEYMDTENPEIINNLPPIYLLTTRGDLLNDHSFQINRTLKRAGKNVHLFCSNDEDLCHAFNVLQTCKPKTGELLEKMLAWLEDQAKPKNKRIGEPGAEERKQHLISRIKDGSINDQKIWEYVKERNTVSDARFRGISLIDCTKEYTLNQVFEEWERYARVFSGLGICGKNKSRVAIGGTITAEPLFSFYGLNMTGAQVSMFSYPDFLSGTGTWKTMIEKEKITDLILSDIMVTPQLLAEIESEKERLGLRHVILLHSLMGGPCIGPSELIFNECNYHFLKSLPGTVFMEDLFDRYKDTPITYGSYNEGEVAIIAHTSGTTKGTRKPIPYTDRAFNATASVQAFLLDPILMDFERSLLPNRQRSRNVFPFDFSSLGCIASTHSSFANSGTVIMTFFGFMHPKFIKVIDYYKLTNITLSGFIIDKWLERTDLGDVDMSCLNSVAVAGSYVSVEKLRKYNEFFKAHGYKYHVARNYGMSEVCGTFISATAKDNDRDILGYPLFRSSVMLQDENDGQYYSLDDGPRTGILHLTSDGMCSNILDGEELFKYTVINDRNFVCTNDLVRLNEDGSLSYVGRADKYFVNNEGKRFDSGLVDVTMSSHPSIDRCAVVPVLEKRIHDTVPVLFVIPNEKGETEAESIRQAFVDVYVREKKLSEENLPLQFMIVDDIPCNTNGKLDIYRMTRDRLNGDAYSILPIHGQNGELIDIRTEYTDRMSSMVTGTLPDGMGQTSAFNLFDAFNTNSNNGNLFMLGKDLFKSEDTGRKRFTLNGIYKNIKENEEIYKITGEYFDRLTLLVMDKMGKTLHVHKNDHDIEE